MIPGIIYHYYRYPRNELIMAFLYGGGLGLIIDQIAELLTEQDYWNPITYPFFFAFLGILSTVTVYSIIITRASHN